MSGEYKVRLEAFEGPLDLLLFLIRRAEVEIEEIPIAAITEQYLSYLGDFDDRRIDIDTAGEFLVMAATLMEIKSRMIARTGETSPESRVDPDDPDDTDPRAELVRQLLEYKKYRDMADGLESRRTWWERRYPAAAAGVDDQRVREAMGGLDEIDLEDIDLLDLVQAFARIVRSVDLTRIGAMDVEADDTPIELHAEDLMDLVRRRVQEGAGPLTLREALTGRSRAEMVGIFLALLDLIRQQRVSVRQEDREFVIEERFEVEHVPDEQATPGE
ncbi:MAG: segregation/condensation protein A [Phycisphaerales bacterium]|nr:segregation/condensation protein A [Phycisphaerales bacterium]